MTTSSTLLLEFAPAAACLGEGKAARDGLSVAALTGADLWVANDESLSLERLSLTTGHGGQPRAGGHVSFRLADYLDLPRPPAADSETWEEADLEGLAFAADYLWLVGSHSLKRKKPKLNGDAEKAIRELAKIRRDGNRYLLARIPMVKADGVWRPVRADGRRTAARLDGDAQGNVLTRALADDPHLAPFLAIPGKDNGFDIEGLAVAGDRLFVGLRGPVLRGWAVILELSPEDDTPGRLALKPLDERRPYLKHLLHLGGLGIRDLCRRGDDLLILAGPTMDLDGPVRVFRWPGGGMAHKAGELVPASGLRTVLDIPRGSGEEHAEGMTLLPTDDGKGDSLLLVYDAASAQRKQGEHAVAADIYPIPVSGAG